MSRILAQGITNPVIPGLQGSNEQGVTILGKLISNLVTFLIVVGFLLTLFFLITGAISWVTSGGDKNNLENARNRIIHAIIGLIILAAVWAIMTVVGNFLGLDLKALPIPTLK